jgi:hypothetical protein
MSREYADYKDIDQEQLQKDIDDIKETIGDPTQNDFEHLLKLERWGRGFTFGGFFLIFIIAGFEASSGFSGLWFWIFSIIAAISIGIGNVARWANVAHPILHGAYDNISKIPSRYTKQGFANGNRRYIDWLDWIKPDAWVFEHNIMHHYHLGEADDPDNIEKNMLWLHETKIPMFFKYAFVYLFAALWKLTYYAPNTLRILGNKDRRKNKQPETMEYELNPFKPSGLLLWKDYVLPYGIVNFVLLPFLFIPLGIEAVWTAFIIILMAEIWANLHSFAVITPNHSADDIYQFTTPHKTQGEYYLRQIMGCVNYTTGSDWIDFLQNVYLLARLKTQVSRRVFESYSVLTARKIFLHSCRSEVVLLELLPSIFHLRARVWVLWYLVASK